MELVVKHWRLPVVAAYSAVLCAAVAWLVRPANQLGQTRPTTIWASLAIGLAAIAILAGAASSRGEPRPAAASVIVASVGLIAALGTLLMLATLPSGN